MMSAGTSVFVSLGTEGKDLTGFLYNAASEAPMATLGHRQCGRALYVTDNTIVFRSVSRHSAKVSRVPTECLTGAKENYSFKVCVLIAVYIQLCHAVTELLQLPDVLHDLLYPVTRKLI